MLNGIAMTPDNYIKKVCNFFQIKLPGDRDFRHACGASIIHPYYIMSAAHCINVIYSLVENQYTQDYSEWNSHRLRNVIRVKVGDNGGSLLGTTMVFAQVQSIRYVSCFSGPVYQVCFLFLSMEHQKLNVE